jgi:tetratricopeptide (TPR) repeat protein
MNVPLSDLPGAPASPAEPAGSLADAPEIRVLYDAAVEALEDGKPAQAIAKLDEALAAADSKYYEIFLLLAEAKLQSSRFGEARVAAEFAARLGRDSADAHYLLGRLFRQRGDLKQAIGHYRTAALAAEHEVNNANITASFFELGECLDDSGYSLAAAQSFQAFDERIWDTHREHRED